LEKQGPSRFRKKKRKQSKEETSEALQRAKSAGGKKKRHPKTGGSLSVGAKWGGQVVNLES